MSAVLGKGCSPLTKVPSLSWKSLAALRKFSSVFLPLLAAGGSLEIGWSVARLVAVECVQGQCSASERWDRLRRRHWTPVLA